MGKEVKIALLGQPNSGKSSIFNALTGSRQHVGNWAGKTVEKKDGIFVYNNTTYRIIDLPGSYGLSANSDEEIVTRDYLKYGAPDLVVVLADASQLERSLYMLADFAGIKLPVMLAITMLDVAKEQGKELDEMALQEKLGIYVAGLVATDKKSYGSFLETIQEAVRMPKKLDENKVFQFYESGSGEEKELFEEALRLVPEKGIGIFSGKWLAGKLIEQDDAVKEEVSACFERSKVEALVGKAAVSGGALFTSDCKFTWIESLLDECVKKNKTEELACMRFDRIALSEKYGKWISVGIILLGLSVSMLAARPFIELGNVLPVRLKFFLDNWLSVLGVSNAVIHFINGTLVTSIGWTVSMLGFVFGINLVFGMIEETGYMARVAYVFDRSMAGLGLQGKSIMPMLVSVGCTVGGVAGTRVVDSWRQRLLTIALLWAVPCGATFAVIPSLAFAFFGWGGMLVMLFLFAVMLLHIQVTAKIFGKKMNPSEGRAGLIMELPPYHRPHFGLVLRQAFIRVWEVFQKAFGVVLLASVTIYLLTYSTGEGMESSMLYKMGTAVEPVTKFFGMGWRTFLAFLASMVSKEAVLGVLSTIYTNAGSLFGSAAGETEATEALYDLLVSDISKAEALAFMTAVTFNVPCVMAFTATCQESRSLKWTLGIAMYYFGMALALSFVVYRLAMLF